MSQVIFCTTDAKRVDVLDLPKGSSITTCKETANAWLKAKGFNRLSQHFAQGDLTVWVAK